MKRTVAFLLAVIMVAAMALTVQAKAPTVSENKKELYAESNEMTQSDLYAALEYVYQDTDLSSLASAAVKKALNLKLVSKQSYTSTVTEGSVYYLLDKTTEIKNVEEPITLAAGAHSVSVCFDYHTDYTYKPIVGKEKSGSTDGTYQGSAVSFTFSLRLDTEMKLSKAAATVTYGDENMVDSILAQLSPEVFAVTEGIAIEDAAFTISGLPAALNAGTYTAKAVYAGVADRGDGYGYQPASAEFTLTVKKAPTIVKVDSSIVTYDGSEHKVNVTVTPESVPYTAITVGIQGDAVGFASIYMSEGNALYKALVFIHDTSDALSYLAGLIGIDISDFVVGSEGVSLSELRAILTNLTKLGTILTLGGIKLEESQITAILETLDTIEKIIPDPNVRFYIKNMPKNEGIYVTYAVAEDENHQTAVGFGNTTIAPNFKVSIKWNESTSGYDFNRHNVKDFDYSAYVVEQKSGEDEKKIDVELKYTITGITSSGKLFSSDSLDDLPTLPGVYTQTAYTLYNYAAVETRIITVGKDKSYIKFVDEGGNLVDTLTVNTQYSGQDKPVKAVVVDGSGVIIDGADVTYSYSGKTLANKTYLSSKAPNDSGTYTVKATFAGNDLYYNASSSDAKVVINKAKASITFDNLTVKIFRKVDVSGVGYTFEGMTAEEAAAIAATLKPDFSVYLFIGKYKMKVSIPEEIASRYEVTVNGGKITAKL